MSQESQKTQKYLVFDLQKWLNEQVKETSRRTSYSLLSGILSTGAPFFVDGWIGGESGPFQSKTKTPPVRILRSIYDRFQVLYR